ncbi:MarR family transcriptional regulator [Streptomyces sp. NPDC016309]|uniref:MarR family transcriptional regulator n=1 Tax=Streptomyces sp. NPDC016309 TaxID=3364965 RepID=UPI0036F761D9
MTMITQYSTEELAAQPAGAWTGLAHRAVVGALRAALAEEDLTQPHWWTLNHVAGAPGTWTRPALTRRLSRYDDQDTDFDAVYDDLVARGWATESPEGAFTLTAGGEAGRLRARERNARVHARMHEGIGAEEYAVAVNVLRRLVANLGGDADLP